MTTTEPARPLPAADQPRRGHHPGVALALIAGTQLMIVLDATIVNIALPHMQRALHFSPTGLSWVLNAYTLVFGGLLLLGGRAGDILGRRRMFVLGVLLFALASFVGGFATSPGWLLGCRALQGVGGAIASPTALSLIATNFAEGPERNRAFGVFAAVSGSGAALGLLAGGMLTSWLSWRWVLFVNAPIAILIAVFTPLYVAESERQPGRFDLVGATTSTAGMTALVYGFIHAAEQGWGDRWTVASFGAAIVLLAAFVVAERAHPQPIVPLHMFRERNRSGSYGVMLALAAALFSMFFFLTLFVQEVLGYSALKAGFAFLPVTAAIVVAAQISARHLLRVGPKPFLLVGAALTTVGLGWLSRISPSSGYLDGLLGPMLVFALGMGAMFVPLTVTAVAGVDARESGAASALLNVMQQVGGSLGLSILVTVFGTASRHEQQHQIRVHPGPPTTSTVHAVLSHGISTAFEVGVVFALAAFVVTALAITARASDVDTAAVPGVAS